jgi:hypothetical protein
VEVQGLRGSAHRFWRECHVFSGGLDMGAVLSRGARGEDGNEAGQCVESLCAKYVCESGQGVPPNAQVCMNSLPCYLFVQEAPV